MIASEEISRVYKKLRLIRRVEEDVAKVYPTDKIKSPVHLSIGQEHVSVGVIDALNDSDYASGTYRGHAVYLAKGGSVEGMIAEMYGKTDGCAHGKGGSMHLVSPEHNVLGASAVVGTHIPVAAGYALAAKREGKGRVVAVFFGDGAVEEGVFYETLNFAALHKLPMLFICENNFYAIHEPQNKRWATDRLVERVETFGIPATRLNEPDVFKLRDVTLKYLENMRKGQGPAFIEAHTYRWREHVGPNEDFNAGYRSHSEVEPWIKNDQVEVVGKMLSPEIRSKIDQEIETQVAAAFAFADASPFPSAKELYTHVFAG